MSKFFYFKEELAYTEDHVLVKSLFLMNIKEELEEIQIQKHFETFGCVKQLHLFPIGNNNERSGYVVFGNPRDAAQALLDFHVINSCHITVKPSDSWQQPDADKMPDKPENVDPNENTASIMKLNDYCLEHIFRKLSLTDRINFARTCFRFRCIYEGISPMLDKSIDCKIFNEMNEWEMRDFFQLSGRNIKQIKSGFGSYHWNLLCEFIGKRCVNLQSMTLWNTSLTSDNIFKIFANLNGLQNLELSNCDINDGNIQALEHLSQLKKLCLSHQKLSAESINCLPASVESLTINGCVSMEHPELLNIIFGKFPLLKELQIPDYDLKDPCIEQLINDNCCKSLEVLSLKCGNEALEDYKHIARLPSLKKLTLIIHRMECETPPMLMSWLVKHKSNQLQHLVIIGERQNCINANIIPKIGKLTALRTLCLPKFDVLSDRGLDELFTLQDLTEIDMGCNQEITDNGILRLILACPKLQVLHLENCYRLMGKLCKDIILNLQNNNDRPLPIKLFVFGPQANELTLLIADLAAKNIVDVEDYNKY
ncbi:uncharacterized protein LOC117784629 [Drosophila innubila]|uniref:uncharacterized protein LOC117784629 n=1 Tax=Drosophila innubila TaxID=198719 RepID=UPI00148B85C0|nr:uncharacterized protein LOC117784629 [Drosophila innubila]